MPSFAVSTESEGFFLRAISRVRKFISFALLLVSQCQTQNKSVRVKRAVQRSGNMKHICPLLFAVAGIVAAQNSRGQIYATKVESYVAGTGYTSGYTNTASATGAPSRKTDDPQFGTSPVDPFSPAYLSSQLVSIGSNGSLTLSFDTPIANRTQGAFGLDFIVFGNSGFVITNGDFGGGGITDGSMFGKDGTTRVSVSKDGTTYYVLNPSLAPVFDGLSPTDGSGNFSIPVDPSLKASDFSGKNLSGIRALYAGSGGGAGYDIAWARDAQGNPVSLDSVQYVKLEVLSGHAEVDAISVVPEPSVSILLFFGVSVLFVRRFRLPAAAQNKP